MSPQNVRLASLDQLIQYAIGHHLVECIRRERGSVLICLGSLFQVLSEEEALDFFRAVVRLHLERGGSTPVFSP